MKKKILFLEQYAKLSGGQKVLLSLIDGLKDDYDISVVIPKIGALTVELDKRNIPYRQLPVGYYSLGKKNAFDILNYFIRLPYLIFKLCLILDKEKPDLIYANAARTFVFATIAAAAKKIPLIWHVHSIFSRGVTRRLCNYFGRNQIVKKVIAVSDAAKLPLTGLWPKTQIFYNCIDEQVYYPQTKIGKIRESLNIKDEIVVSMVGLLVEWKCIDDLIRAAQIVAESFPKTKFLIVGDVLYDDKGKKYKQYLWDMVDELGLEKNVIFTGFRNDIPELMREIDIFVLASKDPDPCPTSLLQAMASGPAPIATNFGGPAEIIKDNVDGLLYTACDYHELAEKILFLIEKKDIRLKIAGKAQAKIKKHFNNTDYIKNLKVLLKEVLSSQNIYTSGDYAGLNPTWHKEDAKWKAQKIINVMGSDIIAQFSPGVELVDIGCGSGEILKNITHHLKVNNIKINSIGYDLSSEIIKQAKTNFQEGDFRSGVFDKNAFKKNKSMKRVVLLIDILEHLKDPAGLLEQVKQISDYTICHLPLEDNFEVNARGLKRHFTKTVGHLNFYNINSARKLFIKCGLNIKNEVFTCSDVSADYKLKSLPRRLIAQPLRKACFKFCPKFTANVLGNCSLMVLLEPVAKG